jgi:hypothetical protein
MSAPLKKALAYLDALEADRQEALALSAQKAEDARLIQARHEGFRAAMEMLGGGLSDDAAGPGTSDTRGSNERRARRRIPQLILRKLSFSGEAMSASQIAKAINYNLDGTQTALARLEETGQVWRNGEDRWEIRTAAMDHLNEHAASNSK